MPPNGEFNSKGFRNLAVVLVVGFLTSLSFSNGQELFSGRCPKIPPVTPFLVHNYSGVWYEVEKYWFVPEALSSCVVVSYLDNGDQTFTVNINQQFNGGRAQWNNPGITRYRNQDESGSFVLSLIVTQGPVPFVFSYPYVVVDTDYTNYTIKHSCKQVGLYNIQSMWILTREKFLSPELKQKIHAKLNSLGLDTSRLRTSDLSTCPAVTESVPGTPINRNRNKARRRMILRNFLSFFANRRQY